MARKSNQSIRKEISPEYSLEALMLKLKLQYLATWCKELTHYKRPWCWERLKAGEEGDERGWDGLMASSTQWTWIGSSSRRWWWTGKPGVLQSMGLQRVKLDRVTEQQQQSQQGFPSGSVVKKLPANTGDPGSIPGSGRSPGEGNGNPLPCSCLENPTDRGSWWATVHGVTRVRRDLETKQQQWIQ